MVIGLLLVALGLLGAVTVFTRRRSGVQVVDFDGYLRRWSVAHDGYDAASTRFLRGWLAVVYRLTGPLARAGVQPDVLTVWTMWCALLALELARTGGAWAVAGALAVVVSGFGDALDGAVAVVTARATARGYVLDSVVDRLNEVLYLVAAWIVGAPAWLAVTCGVVFGLLEYLRARAGNAGAGHVDVITVGERPQRVICCAIAVGLAGLIPVRATAIAGLSLGVLLVLSLAGLAQLAVAVQRLLGPPGH